MLLYCRPGFEKEAAAEISAITQRIGLYGYVKAKADSGYAVFHPQSASGPEQLTQQLHYPALIFPRQLIFALDMIKDLPSDDRISPLLAHIQQTGLTFNDCWLETPDTNDGKQLNTFTRKFSGLFNKALKQHRLMDSGSRWRLHIFFLSSSALYIGVSDTNNSSPLPMGIPRLRMSRAAPSRSTLKLDEALKTMLSSDEQQRYLQNGMSAVDLGACPGGWTWQLVNRGMRVTAIDNGAMNEELMASGLVTHIRADGFKFTPEIPVDWLVCDMVERPLHISRLMARWLSEGLCRYAVFNLKLPMKQRYDIVQQCRDIIEEECLAHGLKCQIRMKQLYHDREEITVVVLQ
ncbi:MAG: 23S rRNA (cytidine(2498)-2'-O)-methyltransferase RlmM [Gammaproteobacteria bacterium]|nr:23S rRNA (cytidine(2498)-2'-O)-methyltransferase RlmM [Gammaproteobacteria bacterium]